MAGIGVNQIIEARYFSTDSGQLGVNVIAAVCTAVTGPNVTPQVMADQLSFGVAPLMKPLLTATAVYYGVAVTIVYPLPRSVTAYSANGRGAGTAGTEGLPKQVCGLIRKHTAISGRAGRGRIYIPFPDESHSDDPGVPNAAYLAAAATLATTFQTSFTLADPVTLDAATFDQVIFHRASGSFTRIVRADVAPKWATQRRRGDFGKLNVPPF